MILGQLRMGARQTNYAPLPSGQKNYETEVSKNITKHWPPQSGTLPSDVFQVQITDDQLCVLLTLPLGLLSSWPQTAWPAQDCLF